MLTDIGTTINNIKMLEWVLS